MKSSWLNDRFEEYRQEEGKITNRCYLCEKACCSVGILDMEDSRVYCLKCYEVIVSNESS